MGHIAGPKRTLRGGIFLLNVLRQVTAHRFPIAATVISKALPPDASDALQTKECIINDREVVRQAPRPKAPDR
jgi:hypothetical protein